MHSFIYLPLQNRKRSRTEGVSGTAHQLSKVGYFHVRVSTDTTKSIQTCWHQCQSSNSFCCFASNLCSNKVRIRNLKCVPLAVLESPWYKNKSKDNKTIPRLLFDFLKEKIYLILNQEGKVSSSDIIIWY